ncbi:MAG: 3'-5' exonuclease, partial [Saprospiraceae bacterium]|nr:3'-5' exonuclease [Saprospiraceae bacterium]
YCQRLTGIQQEDIDAAPPFDRVISSFRNWMDASDADDIMCSWGAKDADLLRNDLQAHQLTVDWMPLHIDLKQQYHDIMGEGRKRGLKRVLEREGLPFEGNHHRALDDASNLSRLFLKYLDRWMY